MKSNQIDISTNAPWVHTASGRAVGLMRTSPADISIRDIAAHISKICRFSGACNSFYSVAQHSILVSNLVHEYGPQAAMYGLMHDAHEAYVGDITTPARRAIGNMIDASSISPIDDITQRLDRAIFEAIGLSWPMPGTIRDAVAAADLRALATERRDLMADGPEWGPMPRPWRSAIKPLPWHKAEEKFLGMFDDLAVMAGLPRLDMHPR